jgi:hypothetical protein
MDRFPRCLPGRMKKARSSYAAQDVVGAFEFRCSLGLVDKTERRNTRTCHFMLRQTIISVQQPASRYPGLRTLGAWVDLRSFDSLFAHGMARGNRSIFQDLPRAAQTLMTRLGSLPSQTTVTTTTTVASARKVDIARFGKHCATDAISTLLSFV